MKRAAHDVQFLLAFFNICMHDITLQNSQPISIRSYHNRIVMGLAFPDRGRTIQVRHV